MDTQEKLPLQIWILTLSAFAIGTAEFVIAGILPRVAAWPGSCSQPTTRSSCRRYRTLSFRRGAVASARIPTSAGGAWRADCPPL